MAPMKRDSERGPVGRWLRQERLKLDVSVEAVSAALGLNPATYRAWESGAKRPGASWLPELARYFGSEPPLEMQPAPDMGALIAALSALTEQIQMEREERRAWERGIERALRAAGVGEGAPR